MDEKSSFIVGFEKQAANPMGWLKPFNRLKAMSRLKEMPKVQEAVAKSRTAHPIRTLTQEGNRPINQLRKRVGYGLIGGGALAYGGYQLQKDPKEQPMPQHDYQPGGVY